MSKRMDARWMSRWVSAWVDGNFILQVDRRVTRKVSQSSFGLTTIYAHTHIHLRGVIQQFRKPHIPWVKTLNVLQAIFSFNFTK